MTSAQKAHQSAPFFLPARAIALRYSYASSPVNRANPLTIKAHVFRFAEGDQDHAEAVGHQPQTGGLIVKTLAESLRGDVDQCHHLFEASVHDSYSIDHMKVAELRQVMAQASEAVMGLPLPTAIKLPDTPEYANVTDQKLQEHIDNRRGIRCVGYMDRLFAYQDKTGRSISAAEQGRGSLIYDEQ